MLKCLAVSHFLFDFKKNSFYSQPKLTLVGLDSENDTS